MTEADSQAVRISSEDDDRHDHVRRIPDIISQVKDSYAELRPAERGAVHQIQRPDPSDREEDGAAG
ncbi:hypothetical protein MPLB_40097 [Mesorhizobium sp. ORS 3324]|nr:hypothetical protein MPLB_40097 [Mesorhizobium sp. ORS 3324]